MHYLSVLAIFKNESMVLKEWIDHNIWQGVDHFYLIDNGSTDNYLDIISEYKNITLFKMSKQNRQIEHYNTVFKQIKNCTDWIMVIDIDEYFYCSKEPLASYIKKEVESKYNKIKNTWKIFGSSGHENQPENIRCSFLQARDVKGLYHPSITNLHKCIYKSSLVDNICTHNSINSLSKKRTDSSNGWITLFNDTFIHLNHYQIMSKEYYQKIKMTRGDVASVDPRIRNWNYFNLRDQNNFLDQELCNLCEKGYK